jgi:hypothetical protein
MNSIQKVAKTALAKQLYGVLSGDDDALDNFERTDMEVADLIERGYFYETEQEACDSMIDVEILIYIKVLSVRQYDKVHKITPIN